MLKNNIEVTILEKDAKVVAEGNYWRYLHPFNDEEMFCDECESQFTSLTKTEIDVLLEKKQALKDVHTAVIKESIRTYTEAVVEQKFLQRELAIMKHIEEVQAYFDKKENIFNEVIKDKPNEEPFNVTITNGIYSLYIWVDIYSKNYGIHGYVTINPYFSNAPLKSVESFENKCFSELAKVETYINNKLKKYNHLFLVKKAILAEDVKRFNIHPRMIKDLGIQVFESKEDILNTVK